MNGVAPRPARDLAARVFFAAAIAIVVLFFIFPQDAARGWLIAFSVFSQVALGSLALLLIHNLTATCWGEAFGPVFRRLLWGVPLLVIFFVPIAVNLRELYPWAASPASIPHDVARIYLNPLSFWVRSAVALAGWVLFAALLLRGSISRLTAALGLTFYGVSGYVLGYDWIMSVGAPFISSSFFGEMAIQAMLAALAAAALFAPAVENNTAKSDLGAFIIAGSAAVFYFALMAFLINWYGDLPEQAEWYLDRAGPWAAVAAAAALFGAAIPIVSLFWSSVRASGSALRLIGISVLFGVTLHNVWLFAPIATPIALALAVVSGVAMAAGLIAFSPIGENLLSERRPIYAR
ncbi:MAG: hypothetical protein WCD20_07910 [Rhodomicrobium sp.]